MYKVIDRPILPKLVFVENTKFKEKTSLFKLDWTYKEKILAREHLEWLEENWPDSKRTYVEAFPAEYRKWLDEKVFAISVDYLDEIRHESQLGMEEWNRNRGFDTVIREGCLNPAISHFRTAFYLLADCCYDQKLKKWDHNRYVLLPALLYRFWVGETGIGLIADFAEVSKLKRLVNLETNKGTNFTCSALEHKEIQKFIDAIDKTEREIRENHDNVFSNDKTFAKLKP
jgi:hypothetical protein